ncbi:hypothetical protein AYO20_09069 [Fonsecaea nubica]|uniref:Uncharacterized protein n=1 Tax=Fonsecaea nubica TaxID=856822 RepID=A0A178CJV1_9EURO|nr:hypothetical protein AYO20_09069 [Fonsecaea nubica]OAL29777.1 hypothetical protein AYO20_09069 [Fonsecaea nubica]
MSAVSVALGDIIKEMSSPKLIDFGVSRIIKNDFKYWQSLLSPDIEGAGYKIVVREEWSTDRTVEYLKAALQLQAVRESLKVGEPRFYIVTGVIYGSKEADGDTSERSAVLGYQCQKASVVLLTAAPPNSTRLVIEQVEASYMVASSSLKCCIIAASWTGADWLKYQDLRSGNMKKVGHEVAKAMICAYNVRSDASQKTDSLQITLKTWEGSRRLFGLAERLLSSELTSWYFYVYLYIPQNSHLVVRRGSAMEACGLDAFSNATFVGLKDLV